MNRNEIAKRIKIACAMKDTNVSQLASTLGMSKENLHAQLQRDNFRVQEIEKIADALGYDIEIEFIDRDSKKKLEIH